MYCTVQTTGFVWRSQHDKSSLRDQLCRVSSKRRRFFKSLYAAGKVATGGLSFFFKHGVLVIVILQAIPHRRHQFLRRRCLFPDPGLQLCLGDRAKRFPRDAQHHRLGALHGRDKARLLRATHTRFVHASAEAHQVVPTSAQIVFEVFQLGCRRGLSAAQVLQLDFSFTQLLLVVTEDEEGVDRETRRDRSRRSG